MDTLQRNAVPPPRAWSGLLVVAVLVVTILVSGAIVIRTYQHEDPVPGGESVPQLRCDSLPMGTFTTDNLIVNNTTALGGKISWSDSSGPQGQTLITALNGTTILNHLTPDTSPAITSDKPWLDVGVGRTADTTAGAIKSVGISVDTVTTKSAGANPLTNYGIFATAAGGDTNWAAYFDQGNVNVNGRTFLGQTVFTGGDETSGKGIAETNVDTNRVIDFYGVSSVVGGSSDATALPRQNFGVYGQATAVRSAGALNVTNYGVYGTAAGAQNNYSGFFDVGTFQVNGQSLFASEMFLTAPGLALLDFANAQVNGTVQFGDATRNQIINATVAATANHGTASADASNWTGSVTAIGANTSVTLTFGGGGFAVQAHCIVTVQGAAAGVITVEISKTAPKFDCFDMAGVAENCPDFAYSCTGN